MPFYEGKTIQILVAAGPGATTDISARLVGRFFGKHVPGNPNVLVQNVPGAGGVVAANQVYNLTKPDGLTPWRSPGRIIWIRWWAKPKSDLIFANSVGLAVSIAPMMTACRSTRPIRALPLSARRKPRRASGKGTGSISYVFANLISKTFDMNIKTSSVMVPT
jgi:hypothetical protein